LVLGLIFQREVRRLNFCIPSKQTQSDSNRIKLNFLTNLLLDIFQIVTMAPTDPIDSSSRGANSSGTVPGPGGPKKRFGVFDRNKGVVTPSPGFMSDAQAYRFLDYIIKSCEDFKDLASADHEQLRSEVLQVIVMRGGEERSYIGGETVTLYVGGKERTMPLEIIPTAARLVSSVVRGFARKYTTEIESMLSSTEVREYFKRYFGSEADPFVLRSDLLHRRYGHKYNATTINDDRTERLSNADEEGRSGG
jgi:hypothetical protein